MSSVRRSLPRPYVSMPWGSEQPVQQYGVRTCNCFSEAAASQAWLPEARFFHEG